MKLQITFPEGNGSKTVTYQWNDAEDYSYNMRQATIMAMEQGLTTKMMRDDKVQMQVIKERDGERCPCCGELL